MRIQKVYWSWHNLLDGCTYSESRTVGHWQGKKMQNSQDLDEKRIPSGLGNTQVDKPAGLPPWPQTQRQKALCRECNPENTRDWVTSGRWEGSETHSKGREWPSCLNYWGSMAPLHLQSQRPNITKEMNDIYSENVKTLKEEPEGGARNRKPSMQISRTDTVKTSILLNAIYIFNETSQKTPMTFFT